MRSLITLAAVIAATALAACGGSSAEKSSSVAATTPAATVSSPGGATTARIAGFAFAPQDIKVKVGQKVTWTNDDSAAHTVTAKSGGSFDSGTLAQGASFSFKASKPGTIQYFCAIHPSMTGTITVE